MHYVFGDIMYGTSGVSFLCQACPHHRLVIGKAYEADGKVAACIGEGTDVPGAEAAPALVAANAPPCSAVRISAFREPKTPSVAVTPSADRRL